MSATDALGQILRDEATQAIADALAPLVDRLDAMDQPRPGVWRPSEAAIVLGVSEGTVRRWVAAGDLDRLPGVETVLIPRVAVERFLDVQTRKAASR